MQRLFRIKLSDNDHIEAVMRCVLQPSLIEQIPNRASS